MKLIMKKTIMDYDLNNKKVIIRCDFNVPISDSKITDDTKIKEALDTIRYAIKNNAKVILMSHLGKVKVPSDKESNSLRIVAQRLGELLGQKVYFCPETHGPTLENMVNTLKDGEVLLMENTRFEDLEGKKESSCDLELSKYWASLGELFINDAYGSCHRAHASVSGIPKYLDSGIGFLVSKEIKALEGILNDNTHPFVVIMGGKKISDKIVLTENLLKKCDILLVGGGMSNTYLKALNYNVGLSIYDPDNIDFCKSILEKYSDKIFLPIDVVVSKSLDGEKEAINKDVSLVEDDDYKAEQIRSYVVALGYELEIRKSFKTGMAHIVKSNPDFVLLDMSIPSFETSNIHPTSRNRKFGGRDILVEMKRKNINIPAIVITQYNVFGEEEKSLEELDKELEEEFAELYRGVVFYNASVLDWQERLKKLLYEER